MYMVFQHQNWINNKKNQYKLSIPWIFSQEEIKLNKLRNWIKMNTSVETEEKFV